MPPAGVGKAHAALAKCRHEVAPFAALLDMRWIIAGHRAAESIFGAVSVDPFPDVFRIASVHSGDVDGAAVAITAGSPASAMQGISAAGLEACGNKADVSWQTIAEQLAALVAIARPDENIDVVIDRQGGRM